MDKQMLQLPGFRAAALTLGVLSTLHGAFVVAQALLLARTIALLFAGNPVDEAYVPLALFMLAFVLRQTMAWLQRKAAGRFAEQRSAEMRQRLLQRIFERGPAYAAQEGSGKLATLAMEGVDRFRAYVELSMMRMPDMLLVTFAVVAAVYALDIWSGLILTAAMPILIAFFILLGLAARKQADRQWATYRMLAHHFVDSLRGLETLRLLGRSREHGETVERVADRYRKATMRTLRVAFLSSLSLDLFAMLSIAAVAVGLGLRLIDGVIGFEAALAVLLLAPEYFVPVRLLGADYHASLDGKEAWRTIRAVCDESDERAEAGGGRRRQEQAGKGSPEQAVQSAALSSEQRTALQTAQQTAQPLAQPLALPLASTLLVSARIKLERIRVNGEHGLPILDDVCVTAEKGHRRIGIVGASGSGKSTLLGVLGGWIRPDGGTISFGAVGGADLCKCKCVCECERGCELEHWQRHIAYIPQQPHLFSMTLLDNVRFYEPGATPEEARNAVEAAGLADVADSFACGILEPLGEGGRQLSGGQAQRVALSRALLSKRTILMLDEPTAHLDVETEWELKQTIRSVWPGKRVFMATHRLHWMKEMDMIWVMDGGRIAETGTHDELVAKQGVYYALLTAGKEQAG